MHQKSNMTLTVKSRKFLQHWATDFSPHPSLTSSTTTLVASTKLMTLPALEYLHAAFLEHSTTTSILCDEDDKDSLPNPPAATMQAPSSSGGALYLFIAALLFRYIRTLVSIYTFLTCQPKPIKEKPKYRVDDVTVVVPTTFKSPGELVQCLRRIASCIPADIFVVTAVANVGHVETCCLFNNMSDVQVLGVEKLNKRMQMLAALERVTTEIVVFADDDVFWPDRLLDYLLAVFEDPKVGAGGTRQRVRRNSIPDVWNFLGISYLERRVWNSITTNTIDGSISTLSGRTAAYRTDILKTRDFSDYFTHDTWRGKPLYTDDDKSLTRYIHSRGWKIALQFDAHATIETTVEDSSIFVAQCLR